MVPPPASVVRPLVLAALGELILLRLLMRIGAVLPWTATLGDLYRWLQLLGTAAANLASLLALALLALLAVTLLRGPRSIDRLSGAALGLAGLLQLGLLLVPSTDPAVAVAVLTSLALASLVSVLRGHAAGPDRLALMAPLGVMLPALYAAVGQPARALGIELPGATLGYTLAEVMALMLAVAAIGLLRPGWRPGRAAAAAALGLLLVAARLATPWSTGLAAIWTVGFSLFLPGPVYGLALTLIVYALLARRQAPLTHLRAAGLLLLVVAGLKLDHGYFALLALAGLSLVTGDLPTLVGVGRDAPVRTHTRLVTSSAQAAPAAEQ